MIALAIITMIVIPSIVFIVVWKGWDDKPEAVVSETKITGTVPGENKVNG